VYDRPHEHAPDDNNRPSSGTDRRDGTGTRERAFVCPKAKAALEKGPLFVLRPNHDVATVIFAAELDNKWLKSAVGDPFAFGTVLGQLYEKLGNPMAAAGAAGRILGMGPNLEKYFRVRPCHAEE
jgi:hypothetical protein